MHFTYYLDFNEICVTFVDADKNGWTKDLKIISPK